MGRAALLGLWHHYIGVPSEGDEREEHLGQRQELLDIAISLINANPTLLTPMRDDHHIEIELVMLLAQGSGALPNVQGYFREVASRLAYRYARRAHWPTYFQDYRELARHPIDRSDAYFERSTRASVLVPFVLTGLERLGSQDELREIYDVVAHALPHMTQQVWVPSEDTDAAMWRRGSSQGIGIPVPVLELPKNGASLSAEICSIAEDYTAILEMDSMRRSLVPLFLLACRHHKLPLPPHLWFKVGEDEGVEGDPAQDGAELERCPL